MEKIEAIHYAHPYMSNPLHPITITLIGCGGTGSLVVARLARLDYTLQQLGHPGLHVTAYDGDIVEETNPGRQNFTVNDIGDFKASNLIQKINLAFGLDWDAHNTYVKIDKSDYKKFPNANITITCVDNADFRMKFDAMLKHFNKSGNYVKHPNYDSMLYWIDCGNGKDFGQVILSTVARIQQPEKSKYIVQETLPTVVDLYGNLSNYDNEATQGIESCSMAESLEKQEVFINDEVAVAACKLLNKLLRNLYLNHYGIIINQIIDKTIPIQIPTTPKNEKQCQSSQ